MNNLRNYKLVIIILLLLSATAVRVDYLQTLINLFEKGLVDNSDNLLILRKLYFNPSFKQSPVSLCLQVTVTTDNIGDREFDCFPDDKAFNHINDQWIFNSTYELQLSNDEQLRNLLVTSGITGVFFAFDPTFYNIMKALSNSFANLYQFDNTYYFENLLPYADTINISLREHLETMPCWDVVDEALRLILVWVSKDQL